MYPKIIAKRSMVTFVTILLILTFFGVLKRGYERAEHLKKMNVKMEIIKKNTDQVKFQFLALQKELDSYKEQLKSIAIKRVRLTFYHPESRGINSDSDPSNTATMTRPIPGRTIAISKALVKLGWLGKKIYIENWGVFEASDRMGPSIEGCAIDICTPTKQLAMDLGVVNNVLATILLEED